MQTDGKRLGIVFPGQGAQKVGMAKDFHEQFPAAREVFDQSSEGAGIDMAALCFEDKDRLALTEFAQPAILTAEIAMLASLRSEYGIEPVVFGGHSLGEYTALVAAGVMPVGQAAALVRERGRLMQDAVPVGEGGMLAVIKPELDLNTLRGLLEGLCVDVANINSSDQVVLSGTEADLATAKNKVKETFERAKCLPLRVSAPFHSRMMTPAAESFRATLVEASTNWSTANAGAVASNYTGEFHTDSPTDVAEALARQIDSPVRWLDNMRGILDRADRVIELGPGRPLRGFFANLGLKIECIISTETAAAVLGT
jgi:[acyl-carrier-protein] S-malonyltransferase